MVMLYASAEDTAHSCEQNDHPKEKMKFFPVLIPRTTYVLAWRMAYAPIQYLMVASALYSVPVRIVP